MHWIVDDDGDIGFSFWNILTLVKYKHSTMFYWFKKFPAAPKFVKAE